jgi:hypothetical protein
MWAIGIHSDPFKLVTHQCKTVSQANAESMIADIDRRIVLMMEAAITGDGNHTYQ